MVICFCAGGADARVWSSIFRTSLQKGVKPYAPAPADDVTTSSQARAPAGGDSSDDFSDDQHDDSSDVNDDDSDAFSD